jgi:hypothetical protein
MKIAFRKFRRTDFWADRVKGGVAGFEVTHRGRGFHPHIHALVDCRWLAVTTPEPKRNMSAQQVKALCQRAQNELAEVWGAYVQGKKASVWVNRAYGTALMETMKYAIKPSELLLVKCPASKMIDEIDRGRMITAFGNAHACSKEFVGLDEPEPHSVACEDCGNLSSMRPVEVIERNYNRTGYLSPHVRQLMKEGYMREGNSSGMAASLRMLGAKHEWFKDTK